MASGNLLTSFDYDPIGQLLRTLDANGKETVSTYDLGGRRTQWVHPDNGTNVYQYDDLGRMVQSTNANSQAIEYVYDILNRISNINFPDYINGNSNSVVYEYYPNNQGFNTGRLKSVQDASGLTQFEYGNMGEIIQEDRMMISLHHNGTELKRTFRHKFRYDS